MEMLKILLTVAVGILGWQAAKKMKLPAAAMLGSLIAVAIDFILVEPDGRQQFLVGIC